MSERKQRGTDRKGRQKRKKDEEEDNEPEPEPTLPDGQKTYCVGGEWSCLESINEAISQCQEGDRIMIKPGRYNEKVQFSKDKLHITGVAGSREEIQITQGLVCNTVGGTIQDCTVFGGVDVETGTVSILNCLLQEAKYTLAVHAFAKPTLKNCLLEKARTACVYMFPDARGHLESNQLKGDASQSTTGVFADNATATFKKNQLDNFVTGVFIQGQSEGLLFDRNEIQNVTGTGIHITNGAKPHCKGNLIHCCQYYGMLIDKLSCPTIDKNTIQASKVMITKGCKATLKNNTITGRVVDENEINDPRMEAVY
eukprot:TRINITY_DN54463_c0_g1_i1.p1 TRINITY_DN54463_c0_g1~~TRINITY_DN54463_c0_g1_i1.p1  ORF type:complete len:312 (-),score=31.49 TRINITY_DN54463_c0_g1_i1:604-1539(-)